jgi:hypothetical protein
MKHIEDIDDYQSTVTPAWHGLLGINYHYSGRTEKWLALLLSSLILPVWILWATSNYLRIRKKNKFILSREREEWKRALFEEIRKAYDSKSRSQATHSNEKKQVDEHEWENQKRDARELYESILETKNDNVHDDNQNDSR